MKFGGMYLKWTETIEDTRGENTKNLYSEDDRRLNLKATLDIVPILKGTRYKKNGRLIETWILSNLAPDAVFLKLCTTEL